MSVNVDLDLQFGEQLSAQDIARIPASSEFETWIRQTLTQVAAEHFSHHKQAQQLTVRVVDEAEIATLNETYRHKSGTTNVLSFPFEAPPGVDLPLLGDIIICAAVVEREAQQQRKSLREHWAHMLVHGTLHLLGYDHMMDEEAGIMESLEISILSHLGFPNPYVEKEAL